MNFRTVINNLVENDWALEVDIHHNETTITATISQGLVTCHPKNLQKMKDSMEKERKRINSKLYKVLK